LPAHADAAKIDAIRRARTTAARGATGKNQGQNHRRAGARNKMTTIDGRGRNFFHGNFLLKWNAEIYADCKNKSD
jgi:hypothetical protein